jgi:hypothetical protein
MAINKELNKNLKARYIIGEIVDNTFFSTTKFNPQQIATNSSAPSAIKLFFN